MKATKSLGDRTGKEILSFIIESLVESHSIVIKSRMTERTYV